MSKIPIKVEREILNNLLDKYALYRSNLKGTDWYREYLRNSKPSVTELYRIRFCLWMEYCSMKMNRVLIKSLGMLPPGLALKVLHVLIRLKTKVNRNSSKI